MANHYYDEGIDNCKIHEDSKTDQFFKLELQVPIGLDKPHGSWKASMHWAMRLLENIDPLLEKDERKVLSFRMGIGHIGIEDSKTCMKYIVSGEEDFNEKR